MHLKNQSDGRRELAYFTNYILRNVIPIQSIGHIHNGNEGIRSWIEKNGFNPIFDFSTHQLSKVDLSDLSEFSVEAIVSYDPFSGMGVEEISKSLQILDLATHAVISAIPTEEQHQVAPKVVYRIKQWKSILEQIGPTIEVCHCDHYSLFLTTKWKR